jgi:hypothetical protein
VRWKHCHLALELACNNTTSCVRTYCGIGVQQHLHQDLLWNWHATTQCPASGPIVELECNNTTSCFRTYCGAGVQQHNVLPHYLFWNWSATIQRLAPLPIVELECNNTTSCPITYFGTGMQQHNVLLHYLLWNWRVTTQHPAPEPHDIKPACLASRSIYKYIRTLDEMHFFFPLLHTDTEFLNGFVLCTMSLVRFPYWFTYQM